MTRRRCRSCAYKLMDLHAKYMCAGVGRLHWKLLTAGMCYMQESELTPSGANLLDGRYAVFGYVVEGQELLQQLQVRLQSATLSELHGLQQTAYWLISLRCNVWTMVRSLHSTKVGRRRITL